jgi:hypothetical protein
MSEEESSYVYLIRGSCEELGHESYLRGVAFLDWASVPYREARTERFDCIVVKTLDDKMPWIYPLESILNAKIFFELTGKLGKFLRPIEE